MDLFTLWLVGHYVDERPVQPPCVVKITQSMRGEAGEPLADRVKRLIQATGDDKDVLFYGEIKVALKRIGSFDIHDINQLAISLRGMVKGSSQATGPCCDTRGDESFHHRAKTSGALHPS